MDEIPTTVRQWLRSDRVGRRFDYDRGLLPNSHLRTLEPSNPAPELQPLDAAMPAKERAAAQEAYFVEYVRWLGDSGMSMGYPAWNLLYFSVLCSLPRFMPDAVVIETGTNRGLSTIAIAQALKDLEIETPLVTVDLDEDLMEAAKQNVDAAGLSEHVDFRTGDSVEFLARLASEHDHFDFVFLDDAHDREHVKKQIDIVCPKVAAGEGKVYFDNSAAGGVAEALDYLRETHGGNLVTFMNCSWVPPGNTIWQPG